MKPDIIFQCRKCGHEVYVTNNTKWINKMKKAHCPECGEEPDENWIFIGDGDFSKLNK